MTDQDNRSADKSVSPDPGNTGGRRDLQGSAAEYRVSLPEFEGPLDLLLHLIREHELDILDIPISFVATKYVEHITLMQELNIDLASEYLVMAATLGERNTDDCSKNVVGNDVADSADDAHSVVGLDHRRVSARFLAARQQWPPDGGKRAAHPSRYVHAYY